MHNAADLIRVYPHLLTESCRLLRHKLISPKKSGATDIYELVLMVTQLQRGDPPVVFFGKWLNTLGVRRVPGGEWEKFSLNQCHGRRVILIEGRMGLNYLSEGIKKARESCASNLGLITTRRQFPVDELALFLESLDWVMVSDELAEQEEHITAHCPGKFRTFPKPYTLRRAA